MKIGKSTRWRSPNKRRQHAFIKQAVRHVNESLNKVPPKDGAVKIYLDDERPCPTGWVLARNPKEFFDLLDPAQGLLDRITDIAFDWYLGVGISTGMDVILRLCQMFKEDPHFLPKLEYTSFHSSDTDKAREMCRALIEALGKERGEDIYVFIGPPLTS